MNLWLATKSKTKKQLFLFEKLEGQGSFHNDDIKTESKVSLSGEQM